jgi:hypothetical protein
VEEGVSTWILVLIHLKLEVADIRYMEDPEPLTILHFSLRAAYEKCALLMVALSLDRDPTCPLYKTHRRPSL